MFRRFFVCGSNVHPEIANSEQCIHNEQWILAAVDLCKLPTLISNVSITRLAIVTIPFTHNWKCYRVAQVVADQQPGCLLQAAEIGADDGVHGDHE